MTCARWVKKWIVLYLTAQISLVAASTQEALEDDYDYFASVPVVLTASRLEQPLNEAPGAMTVIDRETIRLSGARTLSEVLRLVPGFISSGQTGAMPIAAYHVPIDDFGTRNLVLIDGRSVYSSSFVGHTYRGMMDVMLEDIERIEVLRGANSPAYGANAMFGVINIKTRHSADTVGASLTTAYGHNGIRDWYVRVGAGDENTSFRITAGEQSDHGYLNAFDDKRLSQFAIRVDHKPTIQDEIRVTAAMSYLSAGHGLHGNTGNPTRTMGVRDSHIEAEWRRQLNDKEEFKFLFSVSRDDVYDGFNMAAYDIDVDLGVKGDRIDLEFEYKGNLGSSIRTVLGGGYKAERAYSPYYYYGRGWVHNDESRLFGTAEWRLTPQWLLNGGIFVGNQNLSGVYVAPRLMLNWMPSAKHTFRVGANESVRPPTLAESKADARLYAGPIPLVHSHAPKGNARPEKLMSYELGYLGRYFGGAVNVDVRAYHERLSDFLTEEEYKVPHAQTGKMPVDIVNQSGFKVLGVEYQAKWRFLENSEIWLNQNFSKLDWVDEALNVKQERRPPRHSTVVGVFHRWSPAWSLGIMHQRTGSMTWRDQENTLPFTTQTDLRLAKAFSFGATKAELALNVHAAEGSKPVYLVRKSHDFRSARAIFLNLRVEH